jgi:hypothetical protein
MPVLPRGEEKITLTFKPRGKGPPVDVEVTQRDANAANRALELLGKVDEVALFAERIEHSGPNGEPMQFEETPNGEYERARCIALILYKAAQAVEIQGTEIDAEQSD